MKELLMDLGRACSRFSLVMVIQVTATCFAHSQATEQMAGTCTPSGIFAAALSGAQPLLSPQVLTDGQVTLQICAPEAASVRVMGDWNSKRQNGDLLTRNAQGVWSISVGPLKPDLYAYWFMVDGVKTIDPVNVHSANDAVRIVSYFVVTTPGADSLLYEAKDVPHGEVSAVWYSSKYVATPRRALVYTPPGYRGGTDRYPVLYLLHGWGGDETEWLDLGRTAQIMDNLLAAHKIVPMIVVMPNGHHDRHAIPDISPPPTTSELAPLPPKGYDITGSITGIGKSVVNDLVPYVDENFRTVRKSSSRAVAGLSMGGGQSLYIGLNNPDVFAWVASFSGAIIAWPGAMTPANPASQQREAGPPIPRYNLDPDAITRNVPRLNESINGKLRMLYLSCGLDDGLITSNQRFEGWLTEHKIHFTHEEIPGYAHVWSFWRRSLVEVAPQLFR
jgi:enterochelin esterase-like enzyme